MSAEPTQQSRKVWDLPVRIFHWLLVLAIIGAYVSYQAGIAYFKYHLWCGYTVVVLVSFRILWGLVGTYHARFWNFIRGPIHTLRYALATLRGKEAHYAGHNPLGAIMVIVLLGALLVQGITGLFGNDEILNFGPLYGYITNELSLQLTSLHRQLFYWIMGAVALHIIAVIAHRIFKGENLVQAMFTGRKPADSVKPEEEIRSSRLWLAIAVLAIVIAVLMWYVLHAPEPALLSFD
ncbi:MAG: cytochrome b/b6 domain-containing protein [Steroidobacteraceae bacterium]